MKPVTNSNLDSDDETTLKWIWLSPLLLIPLVHYLPHTDLWKLLQKPSVEEQITLQTKSITKNGVEFDVINASESTVKDINATCDFIAPSSTVISSKEIVIYDTFEAQSIKTTSPIKLAFPNQSNKVVCRVSSLGKDYPEEKIKLEPNILIVGEWQCKVEGKMKGVYFNLRTREKYDKHGYFKTFGDYDYHDGKHKKTIHKSKLYFEGRWEIGKGKVLKIVTLSAKSVKTDVNDFDNKFYLNLTKKDDPIIDHAKIVKLTSYVINTKDLESGILSECSRH